MQENAPILAWLRGIAHEGAHLRLDSRDVKPEIGSFFFFFALGRSKRPPFVFFFIQR